MISNESILNVIDNKGAKTAKCIKVLIPVSLRGRRYAQVGDIIMVSLQKVLPNKKVKKGSKYKAIVVTAKQYKHRPLGTIKFNKNCIVLLNKNNEPLGSRLNYVIAKEVKDSNCIKVSKLSLSLV